MGRRAPAHRLARDGHDGRDSQSLSREGRRLAKMTGPARITTLGGRPGLASIGRRRSERQVVLLLALHGGRGTGTLRVRAEADLVGHDGESRVALAFPLPGVLTEAAVDQQEVALRLVLRERLAGLPVHLHVDEQGLVPALATLIFVSARAGHEFKALEVLVLTVVLSLLAAAVFVWGLKLPYSLFAWNF